MALSLGRAGSRLAGVASRSVLTSAKAGAGIPMAHLANPSATLRRNSVDLFSPSRFSHSKAAPTLVMVVFHEDPELARLYAESLSKSIREQVVVLDKMQCASDGSQLNPDSTDVNREADLELDLPEDCPGKDPRIVSFVLDGKLCETEIETILDQKMKAALSGHRDQYVAAVEQMSKNLDLALYRISWKQEALFEKLNATMVAQKILLEDVNRQDVNFMDSFLTYLGQKLLPTKVIIAGRHLMTMLPYGSRYYFYGLFVYGLLTVDIPLADCAVIVAGAHWVAADEIKARLIRYHTSGKEAAKKADDDAKKARDDKKGDGQKKD